jgi:tetratricopeptide (TPR) repeat protein
MANYFQTLQIDESADANEIKRAYFRLVRQFTPEKDPDKFMRIREAYETLSDNAKRVAYIRTLDDTSDMDKNAAVLLNTATDFFRRGDNAPAIATLDTAIKAYPCELMLQRKLAEIYNEAGNYGKALKLFEALLKAEPRNAAYLSGAAHACASRGWLKKAQDYIIKAIAADPRDETLYIMRINIEADYYGRATDTRKIAIDGINAATGAGESAPLLALCGLNSCLNPSLTASDDDMLFFAKTLAEQCENADADKREKIRRELVSHVLSRAYLFDKFDLFPYLQTVVNNIKATEIYRNEFFILLEHGDAARSAIKNGIPRALAALAYAELLTNHQDISDFEPQELSDNIVSLEMDVLFVFDIMRPYILRFKQEYPALYAHASKFLDTALKSANPGVLVDQRFKKYDQIYRRRQGDFLSWDFLGDDSFNMPQLEQRHVAKVGRNDPCPCGSGKKYKQCCLNKANS